MSIRVSLAIGVPRRYVGGLYSWLVWFLSLRNYHEVCIMTASRLVCVAHDINKGRNGHGSEQWS
jgi:hypothetical protein